MDSNTWLSWVSMIGLSTCTRERNSVSFCHCQIIDNIKIDEEDQHVNRYSSIDPIGIILISELQPKKDGWENRLVGTSPYIYKYFL